MRLFLADRVNNFIYYYNIILSQLLKRFNIEELIDVLIIDTRLTIHLFRNLTLKKY